ncbi:signal peptidase I [Cellulomonas triticagri]|uniref:Signal peptidase I n=1 Tax=Cellulomonas triticagri TaxID=2483352 RepID=A0A3M2JKZ5_9CELL|nr:signal peptidase I [Cellulomonas triticagri]RMI14339.1 signal peptidase I [Cellulomonas triticagri]
MRYLRQTIAAVARAVGAALVVVLAAPLLWTLATGDHVLVVTGRSMTPTYQVGDVLLVRSPAGDELSRVGQIVVATLPGSTTDDARTYVHRVVETTPEGAFLQGDANAVADPRPVTAEQVVGVPRLHLGPAASRAYLATQTLAGRLVLGATAALLLLGVPALLRTGRRTRDLGRARAGGARTRGGLRAPATPATQAAPGAETGHTDPPTAAHAGRTRS